MHAYYMWTVLVLYFMQNWLTWVSATLCGNADNVETIRQGTNHRGVLSRRQNNHPLRGFLLSLCTLWLLIITVFVFSVK